MYPTKKLAIFFLYPSDERSREISAKVTSPALRIISLRSYEDGRFHKKEREREKPAAMMRKKPPKVQLNFRQKRCVPAS